MAEIAGRAETGYNYNLIGLTSSKLRIRNSKDGENIRDLQDIQNIQNSESTTP